jgi:hypothetical protein
VAGLTPEAKGKQELTCGVDQDHFHPSNETFPRTDAAREQGTGGIRHPK